MAVAVVVAVTVAAAAVELIGQGNIFFPPLFDYRISDLMHCRLRILILWMDVRLDRIGRGRRFD